MATLERIRNKAGILITAFIGLALLAFVLTDLLQPGKSMFGSAENEIGKIDGAPLMAEDFQNQYQALEEWTRLQYQRSSLDENTTNRLHDQAWEQMIRENLLAKEYEKLGIVVTDLEMLSQISGKNAHAAIQQMFTDPQTGVFSQQAAAESYKRRRENPTATFFWDYMIYQIKNERLYNKYSSLLKKGMYVNSVQVKNEVSSKSQNVDFEYVVKRYTALSDSSITVSDSEIKNYYAKNKENYKQEESRDVQYVTFDVTPSEADNQAVRDLVTKAKESFSNPKTDAALFINRGSDNAPYNARNQKLDDVPANLRGFAETAQLGEVYGPYFEGNAYKLTRLVAVKQLPDSVKARHILISSQTPNAAKTADSIFALAKSGKDFAELARTNSQDPGSAINGGDLGWFNEGMMVKPFNDACFEGDKGDLVKVETQFGWHIINIQDKGKPVSKYELATYVKNVVYSQKTYNDIYAQANQFASENDTFEKFEKAIKEKNLSPRFGREIKANDRRIGTLESPRQLVKWAFDADKGEMSPIFEMGNQFVLASLIGSKEQGTAAVNDVKDQIKAELIKEKKAETLLAELNKAAQGSQRISDVAQKTGLQVQTATEINFASFQVPGAGFEPALVALATSSKPNTVSKAVKGENGVFVVSVTNQSNGSATAESEKAQLAQATQYKVDYKAFDALKAKAEIKDNRIKFY
jgi:peptidyl-prolyl cis-trans isomerase D